MRAYPTRTAHQYDSFFEEERPLNRVGCALNSPKGIALEGDEAASLYADMSVVPNLRARRRRSRIGGARGSLEAQRVVVDLTGRSR